MRYLAVIAVVSLLTGAGAARSAARFTHPPLVLRGMVESGGRVDLGSPPAGVEGELLRYIPHGLFQLGLLLENRSGARLVVTGARVVEPRGTLVHQIGTRFHRWNPPACPPGAFCPAYGFPLQSRAVHPRPFAVARGKKVGVELDFRLGSCAEIPSANPAPISLLRVTYRTPHGPTRARIFSLRRERPDLRMPKPEDCAEPRSSLSVNGPQRYASSQLWTVPGSTGDTCTIRHGTLDFVSRRYQTETSRPYAKSHWERVTLHLQRFEGIGVYRGTVTLVAAGKTVLRRRTRAVEVKKVTKREVVATLQAGRLPSGAVRGTMRCRVASAMTIAARSSRPSLMLGGTIGGIGAQPMHFVPNGHFAVGVVVENRSGQRIVLTAARVVEPRHTLIHQIRTRFHLWSPPHCPPDTLCAPYDGFPPRGPIVPLRPLTVRRGKAVGVELVFRLGACREIPSANPAPISRLRVTFRTRTGQTLHRVLSLGRATLHLQMPKPEDCAQPRSDLKVQGPDRLFTSSESTRPGSKGDVCSVAGGMLNFESRLYLLYARERIYLRLPHFTGTGAYDDGIVTLVARGRTVFRSDNAKVRVTKSTGRRVAAHLFAGHYAHHGERSVPFKIAGTMRCRIRG